MGTMQLFTCGLAVDVNDKYGRRLIWQNARVLNASLQSIPYLKPGKP